MTRGGRPFALATAAYVLGVTAQNSYLFYVAPIALRAAGVVGHDNLAFAASAFATMLTTVPAGRLADRFPRRRVLRIGLALLALAYAPIALATALPNVVLASLLSGAGLAFLATSFFAYVADVLAAQERSVGYGQAGAIAILGSALGPFAGALVFGLAAGNDIAALRTCAALFSLAAIVGLALTLALPHQPRIFPGPGGVSAFASRTMRGVVALYVILGVAFGLTTPYFSVYFLGPLHMAASTWGVVLAAGTVSSAVGYYAAGRIGRGSRAVPVLLVGQVVGALCVMPFALSTQSFALSAAYVARVLFANMFGPIVSALLMVSVDAGSRATASGWSSLAWNAGWTIGAIAGGPLLDAYGGAVFVAGGALGVVAALASATLLRSTPDS